MGNNVNKYSRLSDNDFNNLDLNQLNHILELIGKNYSLITIIDKGIKFREDYSIRKFAKKNWFGYNEDGSGFNVLLFKGYYFVNNILKEYASDIYTIGMNNKVSLINQICFFNGDDFCGCISSKGIFIASDFLAKGLDNLGYNWLVYDGGEFLSQNNHYYNKIKIAGNNFSNLMDYAFEKSKYFSLKLLISKHQDIVNKLEPYLVKKAKVYNWFGYQWESCQQYEEKPPINIGIYKSDKLAKDIILTYYNDISLINSQNTTEPIEDICFFDDENLVVGSISHDGYVITSNWEEGLASPLNWDRTYFFDDEITYLVDALLQPEDEKENLGTGEVDFHQYLLDLEEDEKYYFNYIADNLSLEDKLRLKEIIDKLVSLDCKNPAITAINEIYHNSPNLTSAIIRKALTDTVDSLIYENHINMEAKEIREEFINALGSTKYEKFMKAYGKIFMESFADIILMGNPNRENLSSDWILLETKNNGDSKNRPIKNIFPYEMDS